MDDKLVWLSDVERWILTESPCIDTPADRDYVVDRMQYSIPAVDAVEVRHGHWVTEEEAIEKDDYSLLDTCSVCGHCDWDCTESESFNFCPNCGAKMDGRREDGLYESLKRGLEEAIASENGEIECRMETRKDGDA